MESRQIQNWLMAFEIDTLDSIVKTQRHWQGAVRAGLLSFFDGNKTMSPSTRNWYELVVDGSSCEREKQLWINWTFCITCASCRLFILYLLVGAQRVFKWFDDECYWDAQLNIKCYTKTRRRNKKKKKQPTTKTTYFFSSGFEMDAVIAKQMRCYTFLSFVFRIWWLCICNCSFICCCETNFIWDKEERGDGVGKQYEANKKTHTITHTVHCTRAARSRTHNTFRIIPVARNDCCSRRCRSHRCRAPR